MTIPLLATSAVVPAGWRLRLALAGADFPVVWPPSETFTLSIDPKQSRLTLPVVRERPKGRDLDIPEAPEPPPAPIEWVKDDDSWEVTAGMGHHTLRRERDAVADLPERDNLHYETSQWWTVSVDDRMPTLGLVTEARVALSRPGWDIETRGRIEMSGGQVFDTTVELVALEDGVEVFSRIWHEEIPREWA